MMVMMIRLIIMMMMMVRFPEGYYVMLVVDHLGDDVDDVSDDKVSRGTHYVMLVVDHL